MEKCPNCGRSFKRLKIHLYHCSPVNIAPVNTAPPTLGSLVVRPVVLTPLSESIRRVKELAEDVGGLEELRKTCDALIVNVLT